MDWNKEAAGAAALQFFEMKNWNAMVVVGGNCSEVVLKGEGVEWLDLKR